MLEQPQDPRIAQEIARRTEIADLERRIRSGASNFYWIAGLSIINSLVSLFKVGLTFVVGLGLTQLVDAFGLIFARQDPAHGVLFQVIGLGLSLLIAGIFVLFGFFARKMKRWAFITGLVFYALDSILILAFKDWLGIFFHLLFLYGAWTGLTALKQLSRKLPQTLHDSSFPSDIGS